MNRSSLGWRKFSVAAVVFLSLGLSARPVDGQTVRVVVRADDGSLAGTLVVALDSTGTVHRTAITSMEGVATIRVPRTGQWRIRAERLGFGTAESLVQVGEGTNHVALDMEVHPLNIQGLGVQAESLCGPESRNAEVIRVWMEARSVLQGVGSALANSSTALRVERRDGLVPPGMYYPHVLEERVEPVWAKWPGAAWDTSWVTGADPFLPPEPARLMTEGFAIPLVPGGEETYLYEFHPPHPVILLSDEFLSTHCFSIVRDETDAPGMVGLRFEPNRMRVLDYDVSGEMWLPETTDAWPWIDFEFTSVPGQGTIRESPVQGCWRGSCPYRQPEHALRLWPVMYPDGRLGGRIDLAFDDTLGWIVHRMRLGTPNVTRARRFELDPGFVGEVPGRGDMTLRDLSIMWWIKDVRLEVLEIRVGHTPVGGGTPPDLPPLTPPAAPAAPPPSADCLPP